MLVGAPFKITPQPSQFNHAKSNINIIFSSPVTEQKKKKHCQNPIICLLELPHQPSRGQKRNLKFEKE
jgi:hypothetical protein